MKLSTYLLCQRGLRGHCLLTQTLRDDAATVLRNNRKRPGYVDALVLLEASITDTEDLAGELLKGGNHEAASNNTRLCAL
jgi:hypothetical protein